MPNPRLERSGMVRAHVVAGRDMTTLPGGKVKRRIGIPAKVISRGWDGFPDVLRGVEGSILRFD